MNDSRIQAPAPIPTSAEASHLCPPQVVLFDWHGTLVDTLDAMYAAMDDMLLQIDTLGLSGSLVDPARSKTVEDARLVAYVREYHRLHPKVRLDRRVSRTDLFEILFGTDEAAKQRAHAAFNDAYRSHYGEVHLREGGERDMLVALRGLGLRLGIVSNRDREFLEHELALLDGGSWVGLFDVVVCGGDAPSRKPAADPIAEATAKLGVRPGPQIWYVGDGASDVTAARRAGVASIFFNSAGWDAGWLKYYFPGTEAHPDVPDVVVQDFADLEQFIRRLCAQGRPGGPGKA